MTKSAPPNAVVAAILNRRSVRFGYEETPVAAGDLQTVVDCGMAAPSSKNVRPWRLHVITSKELLNAIADAADAAGDADTFVPPDPITGEPSALYQSTVRESASALREVPCAIALENRGVYIRDTEWLGSRSTGQIARTMTAYGLEAMGLGTALENMWLAASSLGLRAAFLGDLSIANAAAKRLLGLDGDLIGLLALGYSPATPPPRREPPASTQSTTPVVWHPPLGE